MAEAIELGYKYLDDADLDAIAEYLRSLPPIDNRVEAKSAASQSPYD